MVLLGKVALPLLDFELVGFSGVASSSLYRLINSGFSGFPLAFFFLSEGVPSSSSGVEPSEESPGSLNDVARCLPLDSTELVIFEELRSVRELGYVLLSVSSSESSRPSMRTSKQSILTSLQRYSGSYNLLA